MNLYLKALIALLCIETGIEGSSNIHDLYHQAELARSCKDMQGAYEAWKTLAPYSAQASFNTGLHALLHNNVADAKAYLYYALHNGNFLVRLASLACLEQIATTPPFFEKISLLLFGIPSIVWVACLLLLVYQLRFCHLNIESRRKRVFAQIAGYLCILGCNTVLYISYKKRDILLHATSLYAGPDQTFTEITTCFPGQPCTVVCKKNDWYQIKLENHSGWVETKHILSKDNHPEYGNIAPAS